MAQADLVVCGLSHQPFAREVDGVLFDKAHSVQFVNTGSVGRSDEGDPRACYAILELGPGHLQVQHYRLEYDVERAVASNSRSLITRAQARICRGELKPLRDHDTLSLCNCSA